MTPAIRAAKKAKISFKVHEYQHNANVSSFGEEAAALLNIAPDRVFKTLLVSCTTSEQLAVAIVPVSHQLNLKKVAKALSLKKITMADPTKAERATGYVLGGISPLGQKKRLPFVIDETVSSFETVFVSAGRRGLEIELSPIDLARLCSATLVDIKQAN